MQLDLTLVSQKLRIRWRYKIMSFNKNRLKYTYLNNYFFLIEKYDKLALSMWKLYKGKFIWLFDKVAFLF